MFYNTYVHYEKVQYKPVLYSTMDIEYMLTQYRVNILISCGGILV
jgi:hypothetical protein